MLRFEPLLRWLPAVPYGAVQGELVYDGKAHTVTGKGYHDHNWGNIGLNDVMSHWVWGRAHVGEYTLIFVEMVSNKAYGGVKLPVFMLAKGGQILTGDGRPLTLQTGDNMRHPSGHDIPNGSTGSGRPRKATSGSRSETRRSSRPRACSICCQVGNGGERGIVANPYYFRFNAELELEVGLRTHDVACGPALYEIMLLR